YVSYVKIKIKSQYLQPGEYPMRGIPKWQAGLNVAYQLPIAASLGTMTLSSNVTYQSRNTLDDFDVDGVEPGYALVKARLAWDNIGGSKFGGAVFVNNAFNKLYRVGVLGLEREVGFLNSVYGAPRTYGLA